MQISEEISKDWKGSLEKGDNKTLAELLKIDEATVSRIINGKQHTTSGKLRKIKKFIDKKKNLASQFEDDQN